MKTFIVQKQTIAQILSLLLVLLLCASASAQGAAPLRLTDVAWDMTPEEVMEAEGAAGADTTQAYEATGAQYVFNYPAEGGEPAGSIVYAFIGGQLMMCSCTVDVTAQAEAMAAAEWFDVVHARIVELYGEPTQDTTGTLGMLMVMFETGMEDGTVVSHALWDLGDGSILFLENMTDTRVSYTFVNATALFGIPL